MLNKRTGKPPRFQCLAALLALLSGNLYAQTISIDGNRWYEVEITVFSNRQTATAFPEIPRPDRTTLAYPRQMTTLSTPLQALAYDFTGPEEQEGEEAPLIMPDGIRYPEFETNENSAPEALLPRPQVATGGDSFRLPDFERDAFVALENQASTFGRHMQRLNGATDHHVLFHSVWRQPVLSSSQATAIAIAGGEQFAGHHELEGSITISYNVNRVDIDANLWRNTFNTNTSPDTDAVVTRPSIGSSINSPALAFDRNLPAEPGEEVLVWDVPPSPIPTDEPVTEPEAAPPQPRSFGRSRSSTRGFFSPFLEPEPPRQDIIRVDHMQETRAMVSNTLHYLDHPAFGLLVEVRPYELPVPEDLLEE